MYHYFVDLSNGNFSFKEQVGNEEFEEILEHVNRISRLKCDDARFNIVERSYNDFNNIIQRITNGENELVTNGSIAPKFTGFLSCVRKYLDNWETYLKTIYGKHSSETQVFSTETSKLYDNYPEYSFMYRLRNYDQHCEIVFTSFKESIGDDGNVYRVVLVNKNKLLSSPFDGWKQIDRDFIDKLDEDFDILPIIKKYFDCIKQLHSKLLYIHAKKELFNSCAAILKIANRFENENAIEILSSEKELSEAIATQERKSFQCTHLYIPECKHLLKQVIKENVQIFRIFVQGEELCSRLKDVAYEVSDEKMSLLTSPTCHFAQFEGQQYLRYKYYILYNRGAVVIFIHNASYTNENKEMINEFCEYIKEISKI